MDVDQVDRLIERYFDGVITPPELEMLNDALAADAEAARRFARAARMESAFELHFRTLRAEAAIPLIGSSSQGAADPDTVSATAPGRIRRMLDHLWGPSLAVLAHAAILLILLRWVLLPSPRPGPPFPVTLQPERPFELDTSETITPPDAERDVPAPPLMTLRPREPEPFVLPPAPMPARLFPRPAEQVRMEPPPPLWPDWYAERTLSARRQRLLVFGRAEADAIDQAAEGALAALARLQRPDGSWPARDGGTTQVTALAVLAFLSRGHLPGHPLYGPTVEAGLRWLIDPPASAGPDPLAAGVLALSEAYLITRIPSLADLVRDRSALLIEAQQADGGWRAGPNASGLAATTWRMHVLVTVRAAGRAPAHLDEALLRAAAYVRKAAGFPGPDVLQPAPGETLELAAAWRALQLVGEGRSVEARRVERRLRRHVRTARNAPDPWPLLALHETALALAGGGTSEDDPDADIRFVLRRALAQDLREASPLRPDAESAALTALTLGAPYRYHGEAPQPTLQMALIAHLHAEKRFGSARFFVSRLLE